MHQSLKCFTVFGFCVQTAVICHVQSAVVTELPIDISTITRQKSVKSLSMVVAWAMTINLTLLMSARESVSSHTIQACFLTPDTSFMKLTIFHYLVIKL